MIKDLRLKNKRGYNRKSEGFTLIELLVVIAIIGILAGLLMSNFVGVRQRARDGARKSDLRQIQSALELFRSDHSCYPGAGCVSLPVFPACGSPLAVGGIIYMQKIPCDPLSGSYTYLGGGNTYTLKGCLENTNDADGTPDLTCTSNKAFTLLNP